MSSGKRRMQRKINKNIRIINKNIENDNLWRGRFVVRQVQGIIKQYDDRSGYHGWFTMRVIDKKTGLFRDEVFDNYDITLRSSQLFWFVNDFIVDDVKVWEENPSPKDNSFIHEYKEVPVHAVKRVGWEKRISGK